MIDQFELEQFRKHPDWRATLEVYQDRLAAAREQSPEFDGWIPRLLEVDSVDSAHLPSIHGKLIAFGFLKFDVGGRDVGIRYQLTPQAKQALSGKMSEETDDDHGEAIFAQSA